VAVSGAGPRDVAMCTSVSAAQRKAIDPNPASQSVAPPAAENGAPVLPSVRADGDVEPNPDQA